MCIDYLCQCVCVCMCDTINCILFLFKCKKRINLPLNLFLLKQIKFVVYFNGDRYIYSLRSLIKIKMYPARKSHITMGIFFVTIAFCFFLIVQTLPKYKTHLSHKKIPYTDNVINNYNYLPFVNKRKDILWGVEIYT